MVYMHLEVIKLMSERVDLAPEALTYDHLKWLPFTLHFTDGTSADFLSLKDVYRWLLENK